MLPVESFLARNHWIMVQLLFAHVFVTLCQASCSSELTCFDCQERLPHSCRYAYTLSFEAFVFYCHVAVLTHSSPPAITALADGESLLSPILLNLTRFACSCTCGASWINCRFRHQGSRWSRPSVACRDCILIIVSCIKSMLTSRTLLLLNPVSISSSWSRVESCWNGVLSPRSLFPRFGRGGLWRTSAKNIYDLATRHGIETSAGSLSFRFHGEHGRFILLLIFEVNSPQLCFANSEDRLKFSFLDEENNCAANRCPTNNWYK